MKKEQEQSKSKPEHLITDGNWAAADVAYRLSEFMAIFPITPSSTMGELADEWAFQHKKNIWGVQPSVIEMESEGGAAGALHGALQMGSLATTFTASQGLLLMIPNMYKIAGEHTPFVMHVAARALATHALSIFGDHSDVMSARQTGFAMLSSNNVQAAHDLAAIAHASTLRARVPFMHFFDGFRTSHEESRITRIPNEVLHELVTDELVLENRARGMSPNNPTIRGTAQNPDVYFQGREAANPLYNEIPKIVAETMEKFSKLTGREYKLVEYIGDPKAENVVVAMGSAIDTITETLPYLPSKTGLIAVHLYRPFPTDAFIEALPKTVKRIAVLDRTKESGATGEPLYQDIVSTIHAARLDIDIVGGRYGLGSKEFKPRDVKAIYEMLISGKPKHNFVVGIVDDLTNNSLPTDEFFTVEDKDVKTALLYGIGSDGTVGAVKNIVKIVGENSDLYPQSYAVYDSKKSGGLTVSHLRFGEKPIKSQYLVESADFIGISNFVIAQRFDIFKALKPGGSVMFNTGMKPEIAFANLPHEVQELLIRNHAHVYFLDANRGATELGLGNRINTFILLNFFNITQIIDPTKAADSAKAAIEKTYKKKGAEVVSANWAAVDRAGEFLTEYKLPSSPSNFAPDFIPAMTVNTPVEIAGTLGEMAGMRGDSLPVSTFKVDGMFGGGQYPVGTSKYEKRAISDSVATVDLDKCIQCGKCSMLCPHAAIRQNVLEKSKIGDYESVKFVDYKTPELGSDLEFTLNISPADCTGCEVCAKNCPVNALSMVPLNDTENQQKAFDEATNLPEFPREKLNLNLPKHLELTPHYFEFPGACAGCGETPYIKMLAHLFGDRMVVANATGCSSIYSGNLPTTPWTKDANGRGPAWSNSLFEDNAEYGLGMRMALNQRGAALKSLLFEVFDDEDDKIIEKILAEKDIEKQRENEKMIREKLAKIKNPRARIAESLADAIVDKSVWIIGGDGWAYDIGYGGLDHILHSGQNVNILVLDTEGYSNTGGQQSKATPFGASMKFAVGGKEMAKKDLGMIAMMSGAYVAQIALGSNQAQAIKAFREAEAFNGPSIILAYSPCIAHGYALNKGVEHQHQLVGTGAWPLYRFNPNLIEQGKNPLTMDSGPASVDLEDFLKTESRFSAAKAANPNFDKLVELAKNDNVYRRELKQHIANFAMQKKDS